MTIAGFVLAGLGTPAHAAPGDRVGSYDIDATVADDGVVEVVERFDYEFANVRDRMPLDWIRQTRTFRIGPDGDWDKVEGGFLSYEKVSIERDNQPVGTWMVNDAWWRKTWIGPFETALSGRHSYEIRYRLDGLVGRDGSLDWSPVPGYDADRSSVRIRIRIRGAVPPGTDRAACAIDGAAARCEIAGDGDAMKFTASDLPPGASVRLHAPTTARAGGAGGPLPGVGEFMNANLGRPGARLGVDASLAWGAVVLLGILGAGVVVLAFTRPVAPERLRDSGAAVALAAVILAYPLGAYDLLIFAAPIAICGILLAAIGFSLLRLDRQRETSPPGAIDRA